MAGYMALAAMEARESLHAGADVDVDVECVAVAVAVAGGCADGAAEPVAGGKRRLPCAADCWRCVLAALDQTGELLEAYARSRWPWPRRWDGQQCNLCYRRGCDVKPLVSCCA